MKGQRILTSVLVLVLTLTLAVGLSQAGGLSAPSNVPTQDLAPLGTAASAPLSTSFTYQGQLKQSGSPANGTCDFQFSLWDAASGGTQIASTQTKTNVSVTNGLFTIPDLDFGSAAFTGEARWLEIAVRYPAGSGSYTTLTPRQALTATPYALYAQAIPLAGSGSATTAARSDHDHFAQSWVGETPGGGSGLLINNTSTTGGDGIYGETASGLTGANSYAGVHGVSSASVDGYGVVGVTQSSSGGAGVGGFANQGDAAGVRGETYSDAGGAAAVVGRVASTSPGGYSAGVRGINEGTGGGGIGVWGSQNGSGWGVYGTSSAGVGVYGVANEGYGVLGWSGSGVGVVAKSDSGDPLAAYSGGGDRRFYVANSGEVYADGSFHPGGADFAEMLPGSIGLEPGDVLVVGPDGALTRSTEPYQASVVGVYSSQPGVLGGAADGVDLTGKVPLAVMGVVPIKVSAENGAIQPGDLLTTSSTPGHAMKVTPVLINDIPFYRNGVIIGKALGSLKSGTGVISMLVMLQ
jgi:hypothetical protein